MTRRARALHYAALISLAIAPIARAQRTTSQVRVRAELAATLLAANRLPEAAVEYRQLLTAEPNNHAFRLGLARALAWSNHPQEAERELLAARDARNSAEVEQLLRSVRVQFDATPSQATGWMHEAPGYLPYRLALARALARTAPSFAVAQYDTLRLAARGAFRGSGEFPPMATLMREQAYALLDSHRYDAARAELDTLVAQAPTPAALNGRASASLALHDTASAVRDLQTSIATQPSYDAYYSLASVSRQRADYANARMLYDAARRLAADPTTHDEAAAALGALAREERPVLDFVPALVDDGGWRVGSESAIDNTGVSYMSVGTGFGIALGDGVAANASVGARRIAQRDVPSPFASNGTDVSLGIGYQTTSGPVLTAIAIRGGVLSHPGVATFAHGAVDAAVWRDAWELGGELSHDPAYQSLFSATALTSTATAPRVAPPALIANSVRLTAGGPIGALDVAANAMRASISDGNVMNLVQGRARVPLDESSHLYAVYAGTVQSFARRSPLYWDPAHFASSVIGPERHVQRLRGFSYSVRLLGGIAHSLELLGDSSIVVIPPSTNGRPPRQPQRATTRPLTSRWAAQVETGGDATYRAGWWEGTGALVYGSSRAGGYQRVGTSLTFRRLLP